MCQSEVVSPTEKSFDLTIQDHPMAEMNWKILEVQYNFSIIITFFGIFWDSQHAVCTVKIFQRNEIILLEDIGSIISQSVAISRGSPTAHPPVKHPPFFASPHVKEDGGERQNDHPGINPQGVRCQKTARDHQSWDTNLKMGGKHGSLNVPIEHRPTIRFH